MGFDVLYLLLPTGFEPVKLYALPLEESPVDRLGKTALIFVMDLHPYVVMII